VELDWLETFLAVVDRGGFTAASTAVHRSQSRVSAHIAALERELSVQLIDRSRRPAAVTTAGRIFAAHARDILADVGSARSAIGILRALDSESLAVLTTPCIASAFFPGVLTELLGRHPGARITLSEQGWLDTESRHPGEGFVLAVLPTLARPQAPGLNEQLLWREPMQLVLPAANPIALGSGAIDPHRLAEQPLIVTGASANSHPALSLLRDRGIDLRSKIAVDSPQTLVSMVRSGVGIGLANAVAIAQLDTTELQVRDLDDPLLEHTVAAYWYDVLLSTEVGQALQETVIKAPLPAGAIGVSDAPRTPLNNPTPSSSGRFSAVPLYQLAPDDFVAGD
jgi:DNA-binding transcriptional LysR family regulator